MFCMLAARCGEPQSVLKEKWPERDARELAVYLSHEPPIERLLDFWFSQQIAASVNPWRKKGARAVNPKDIIPDWWGAEEKERTNADWIELLSGMNAALGGKVENVG